MLTPQGSTSYAARRNFWAGHRPEAARHRDKLRGRMADLFVQASASSVVQVLCCCAMPFRRRKLVAQRLGARQDGGPVCAGMLHAFMFLQVTCVYVFLSFLCIALCSSLAAAWGSALTVWLP